MRKKNFQFPIKAIAPLLALFAVISPLHAEEILFEESFANPEPRPANKNLATIGWRAYGGAGAEDLSAADKEKLATALIAWGYGSDGTERGYLGFMMGEAEPNFPEYAVVKTGLSIRQPREISWTMHAGAGATAQAKLLVQIDSRWYASAEVFRATAFGEAEEFGSADPSLAEKRLLFETGRSKWMDFTLKPDQSMGPEGSLSKSLPSGNITGIGFFVSGGGTGRIDNLRVTD